MSGTFEVGASVPLRALHRLPWGEPEEREPHAHDYRIEIVVERSGLDERGVVIDLDVLNAALATVTGRLEGRDLDEALASDGAGVTVEVLARWLHGELRDAVRGAGGEVLCVRVWEAPDAFGGYRAAVGGAGPGAASSA
jgi:6-pyruvoyltetrahydropterin/6-carboxytetrahydropterin synthase